VIEELANLPRALNPLLIEPFLLAGGVREVLLILMVVLDRTLVVKQVKFYIDTMGKNSVAPTMLHPTSPCELAG